mgnify:CR=1 FL=1
MSQIKIINQSQIVLMEQIFSILKVTSHGEGFTNITNQINQFIKENNLSSGMLIISSMHTSCSLTINENADPNVLSDLKKYMQAIVPYNSYVNLSKDPKETYYDHYQEGEDDMPAHIKTALTNTSLSLSFRNERLILGQWQAIYLWEHRFDKKERTLNLHIIGEKTKHIYN